MRTSSFLLVLSVAACGGGTTPVDGGAVDGGPHDGGARDAPPTADASDLGSTVDAGSDLGDVDAGPCTTDGDGDGHVSMACGGDDCNDADPNRYPGNPEVCDPSMHDEDCDSATFGMLDTDHDGYVSGTCCNLRMDGSLNCGDDCNDADPSIHPTAVEVCNGRDDNCDGNVDEGVPISTFYVDCDGDGYGVDGPSTMMSCSVPSIVPPGCAGMGLAHWSTVPGDCNDAAGTAHPGAVEQCDGIDNDCDGVIETDADGDMHYANGSCVSSAGELPADDCRDDLMDVHPGITAYSGAGICPVGQHTCPVFSLTAGYILVGCYPAATACPMPARACPGAGCPPAATFDYTCDMILERQPASTFVNCPTIFSFTLPCGRANGLVYSGSPTCGSGVTMRTCAPSGTTCAETDMTVPLPCR